MERTIAVSEDDPTIDLLFGSDPGEARFVMLSPELRRLVADPLTPREVQVLRLIARGQTNRQIARALGVQEVTVKSHCRQLFRRIGVCNRTEAAVWAARHGAILAW